MRIAGNDCYQGVGVSILDKIHYKASEIEVKIYLSIL
jgi:hypothetical protein